MDSDEVRKAQAQFVEDTKKLVRKTLEDVDKHPVGHTVLELARAKRRGELETGEDALRTVWKSIFGDVLKEGQKADVKPSPPPPTTPPTTGVTKK